MELDSNLSALGKTPLLKPLTTRLLGAAHRNTSNEAFIDYAGLKFELSVLTLINQAYDAQKSPDKA